MKRRITISDYSTNRLGRFLSMSALWPDTLRLGLLQFAFGWYVPYFRTSKARLQSVAPTQVSVCIPFNRRTRNHMGGVHAVAATLAAETAAGLLVGLNVADGLVVVVKEIHIELSKGYKGSVVATAAVDQSAIDIMRKQNKGALSIAVVIEDSAGNTPIKGRMEMAWLPARK